MSHFVITHDVEKSVKKVLTFFSLGAIIVKLCRARLNIKHTSLSIMESGERLKKLFKKLFKKVLTKGMECDIISELCAKRTATTKKS